MTNIEKGHPVGLKAAAHYTLCPELTLPANAQEFSCNQATCAVVCNPGLAQFTPIHCIHFYCF